jgi:hypothetical protein
VFLFLVLGFYFLWIGRILWELHQTRELQSHSKRFQVLLGASCFVLVLVLAASILESLHLISHSAGSWTGFYSLFNIYVFLLVYLYTPHLSDAQIQLRDFM